MSRMGPLIQFSSYRRLVARMPWGRYLVLCQTFTILTHTSRFYGLCRYTKTHSEAAFIDMVFNDGDVERQCNYKNFPTDASAYQSSTKQSTRHSKDSGKTRTCAPEGIWIATRRYNHSATLSYLLWRSGLLWLMMIKLKVCVDHFLARMRYVSIFSAAGWLIVVIISFSLGYLVIWTEGNSAVVEWVGWDVIWTRGGNLWGKRH